MFLALCKKHALDHRSTRYNYYKETRHDAIDARYVVGPETVNLSKIQLLLILFFFWVGENPIFVFFFFISFSFMGWVVELFKVFEDAAKESNDSFRVRSAKIIILKYLFFASRDMSLSYNTSYLF